MLAHGKVHGGFAYLTEGSLQAKHAEALVLSLILKTTWGFGLALLQNIPVKSGAVKRLC